MLEDGSVNRAIVNVACRQCFRRTGTLPSFGKRLAVQSRRSDFLKRYWARQFLLSQQHAHMAKGKFRKHTYDGCHSLKER